MTRVEQPGDEGRLSLGTHEQLGLPHPFIAKNGQSSSTGGAFRS